MRPAIMIKPGEIIFQDIPRPKLQSNEVLIQVKRIGVCGSDIHVYHGLHPYTSYPVVQGHEVAGVIAEVGAQVEGFAKGDKAVFMPQVTCGTCYPCRHGMYHICDALKVMGFQTNGKLHLDPMVTHRFAFEAYLDAYKAIESSGGRYMKVMIDL